VSVLSLQLSVGGLQDTVMVGAECLKYNKYSKPWLYTRNHLASLCGSLSCWEEKFEFTIGNKRHLG
jgi:hypothetical protein